MAIVCAALFGSLALLVDHDWGPLRRLDHSWVAGLHRYAVDHPAWAASMRTLTEIGGPVGMRSALGIAAVWLWFLGARVLAGWLALQDLLGWLVSAGAKATVDRPRPHFADPVAHAPGGSYPSGHAMAAAITCLALLTLVPARSTRGARIAAATAAGAGILAVGWTRIALGVHWPSDVLAGWLAAGAVLGATTAAVELWQPGALLRDAHHLEHRTSPRVQRVLAHELPTASSPWPGQRRQLNRGDSDGDGSGGEGERDGDEPPPPTPARPRGDDR